MGLKFCRGLSSYSLSNTGLYDATAHKTADQTWYTLLRHLCIYSLLNGPVINSNHIASNYCPTVNNELERARKAAIVVYFNMPKGTDEKPRKAPS
jgi:hypothetical protein